MGFTTFQKITHSLWGLFSLIMFLNGVGFLIIGKKVNEKKWIISGIIYEIPWIIALCIADYDALLDSFAFIIVALWFISIIHTCITIPRYLKKLEAKKFGENTITYNSAINTTVPNGVGNAGNVDKISDLGNVVNKVEGVNSNLNGNRTIDFNFKPDDAPVKSVDVPSEPVDINTASEEELSSIPGFNLIIAKRIIELRNDHKITSAEELGNELNLKPHVVNNLRKYASFDNSQIIDEVNLKSDVSLNQDLNQVQVESTQVDSQNLEDVDENPDKDSKLGKKGRKLDF